MKNLKCHIHFLNGIKLKVLYYLYNPSYYNHYW